MRPIDADAVLKHIEELKRSPWYNGENGNYERIVRSDAIGTVVDLCIKTAPTLDYAPVRHGYWKHEEPVKDDGQKPFVCSTCGLRHPRYGDVDKAYFSYCPWCGTQMDAEMDGGKKDGK